MQKIDEETRYFDCMPQYREKSLDKNFFEL